MLEHHIVMWICNIVSAAGIIAPIVYGIIYGIKEHKRIKQLNK